MAGLLALCMFFSLCQIETVVPTDWHGLAPLRSTKSDVINKKLKVVKSEMNSDSIETVNYRIYVTYSTTSCEKVVGSKWNVPIGTVVLIDVLPNVKIRLSQLDVDLKRYKVNAIKDVAGAKIYTDEVNGFEFEYLETKDAVVRITYFPGSKNSNFRCP